MYISFANYQLNLGAYIRFPLKGGVQENAHTRFPLKGGVQENAHPRFHLKEGSKGHKWH